MTEGGRPDDPALHPGPRDAGGQGGMATREQAARERADGDGGPDGEQDEELRS